MGLLSLGTPEDWENTKKVAQHVKEHGIEQFINIYRYHHDRQRDYLKWGDEVEFMIISFDDVNRNARLSLRGDQILEELTTSAENQEDYPVAWHPEFGRFMIEATPSKPYGNDFDKWLMVEENMRIRRELARKILLPNEHIVTLTSFPRLGAPGICFDPHYPPTGPVFRSLFLPDESIQEHPRFPTLAQNIRCRRGAKVAINVPIYFDVNTPKPFIDPTIPFDRNLYPEDAEAKNGAALPDHVYMDAQGFGMGCSCLQITFQACCLSEARNLYDQLAPLGPIMLALTAASPAYRGYLTNVDCRWNVISKSVDDRTLEERGLKPLSNDRFKINKSRYDSIDSYLSPGAEAYNDIPLVYDRKFYDRLRECDIDDLLAKHIAHLFIRDPLVVFKERLDLDDQEFSDHFENIQSTNWQTLRFKPPPPKASIGWRVEFRTMELQLTDFENAAFAVFIALVTRTILSYNLNLYLPISKVDENMQTAQLPNAVRNETFHFRNNNCSNSPSDYEKRSIRDIMIGTAECPGLIPLVEKFLNSLNLELTAHCRFTKYLDFIKKRASGELITTASWIRKFMTSHPEYAGDSIITPGMNYDFLKTVQKVETGEHRVLELHGDYLFGC